MRKGFCAPYFQAMSCEMFSPPNPPTLLELLFNYLSVAGSPFLDPEPLLENIVQGALELDAQGAIRTTGVEIVRLY